MRASLTAALLLCVAWSEVWAQTELVWGRDCTFERMVATRSVEDAHDRCCTAITRAAQRTTVPSIWLYAARDPFYAEGTPQELVQAWRAAGGKAEFVFITNHSLQNPHALPSSPMLWSRQLDAFLE